MIKVGHSFDIHKLVRNRKLYLGGILLPYNKGLLGHSDADCLLHAITEAIIGALGKGDIGEFFPDSDPLYKGKESRFFLDAINNLLKEEGYKIVNIDAIIYAEKPNLSKYKKIIGNNIASILGIDNHLVNIKATTLEKMGHIGRGKALASEAVVLIEKIN